VIRLVVCDDHELMRVGLVRALTDDPQLSVVAQAKSQAELLQWLDRGEPADVLLLDLSLGAATGWAGGPAGVSAGVAAGHDLIRKIHAARRGLAVIVVSMHDDAEVVSHALQAGAKGYVTKSGPLQVLVDAIYQVHQGQHFLAPALVEPYVHHQHVPQEPWNATLTKREREVLGLICDGKRLSEIATDWGVSIKTVSTHKVRLMEKLNVNSNAALVKLAVRHGLS
jgi:DNA-binding NarL/FixJ family response regulator